MVWCGVQIGFGCKGAFSLLSFMELFFDPLPAYPPTLALRTVTCVTIIELHLHSKVENVTIFWSLHRRSLIKGRLGHFF